MKFTDLLRTHDVPYGWEEQENYNRVVPSNTTTDLINGIAHPEDRAAAARLKAIHGADFDDEIISTLSKEPGRLTTMLRDYENYNSKNGVKKALAQLGQFQEEKAITPGMDYTTASPIDLRRANRNFRVNMSAAPRTADEMIAQGLVKEGIPQREIGRMVANTNMGAGTLTDIADASGGGIKKLAGYLRPSEHRLLETLSVDEPGVMNLLKLIGKMPK